MLIKGKEMNFGKPKNLSEMDFIDLDDNELWEKKISLLESMAIQIIGMFQYQIKKDFLTVHYF